MASCRRCATAANTPVARGSGCGSNCMCVPKAIAMSDPQRNSLDAHELRPQPWILPGFPLELHRHGLGKRLTLARIDQAIRPQKRDLRTAGSIIFGTSVWVNSDCVVM